jgi:NAD(P)-dependent dehydrogenase (short-subunit alcohol dehydrogenase family)
MPLDSETRPAGLLAGKVGIITGAGRGIGAAAARLFAAEGAAVVLCSRTEKELDALTSELRDAGAVASYVVADVSVDADMERAVATAVAAHGRLDIAFNNAGTGTLGTLDTLSIEDFDQVMGVNLRGVWLSMRHELRAMTAAGGGAIVNNSAVGGLIGSPNLGAYGASKHGVAGLTKTAAADFAASGIRVNAIAPGTALTPLIEMWFEAVPGIAERLAAETPLKRIADAREIAEAALWLCSDRSSYVTGVVLPVDGGYTVL